MLNGRTQDVVPAAPPKFEDNTPGYRGPQAAHVDDPAVSTLGQRTEAAHEIQRMHNRNDHSKCTAAGCAIIAKVEKEDLARV